MNDFRQIKFGGKLQIIYWGEDGAIGTPPRLQLIRDEILQSGTTSGWEAMDYMKWYDAYDSFLKHNGFAKAFPTVDDLTRAMGEEIQFEVIETSQKIIDYAQEKLNVKFNVNLLTYYIANPQTDFFFVDNRFFAQNHPPKIAGFLLILKDLVTAL